MLVVVRLTRDGVDVTMTQKYHPELFKDYMLQAREMAHPFFWHGYHMVFAELQTGGTNESTKVKQRAKESDS